MYTTIVPRKFKEKVYNRKQWIKFRLLMKRQYATQSGNLNSTTQKKVGKKSGWTWHFMKQLLIIKLPAPLIGWGLDI